jgi:hypothetical protein
MAILGNQIRMIEIDWKIKDIAGWVDINNLDVFPNGSWFQGFPGDLQDN